ncbi:glycosyltransferase involved in cell wall biosynthesis [Loktanella ponticola]|uniref:Glycosyltransferase involved in cell wall biosynthesis n=1 Tax=Yoonia ponticola TaxID=1524255 RepID=A0A7W9BP26_9RHOB|nr:glycosyltransferase family 4 protein [Yoonia ponticola]MBB5723917.1 glycosyltransferase involved in cell wall biosynthesis [Yoonia ponticola]
MVLRQTIRAVRGAGHDAMLCVGSQGRGCLEDAGVPIRRYWYRRSRFRILTLFTFVASQLMLYRLLSRSKLPKDAVIYVNTLLPFGAALWGRMHGHRVITHVHEVSISPSPLRKFLVGMQQRCADRLIYVSRDNRDRLPIADVPQAVVPNPVAPEIATLGANTPYMSRRSGQFEVLMLASPRDFKGVPEFVALARSFEAHPDIMFTLVLNGDATEVARYVPAVKRPSNLGLHPRTEAPEHFYATADILLNLSRPDEWVETFGLTLVEAMAFGVPVIGPPVGGPVEIITHGKEGYLCDGRDASRLHALVAGLAQDPTLARSMSEAARTRASDFTMSQFTANLAAQLQQIYTKKETS